MLSNDINLTKSLWEDIHCYSKIYRNEKQ